MTSLCSDEMGRKVLAVFDGMADYYKCVEDFGTFGGILIGVKEPIGAVIIALGPDIDLVMSRAAEARATMLAYICKDKPVHVH